MAVLSRSVYVLAFIEALIVAISAIMCYIPIPTTLLKIISTVCVFMITMMPVDAFVQPQSESLMSQIQSFNEKNGIEPVTENVTQAPAGDEIAHEELPVKTEEVTPIKVENVSEIRNFEDEIIESEKGYLIGEPLSEIDCAA